MKAPITVRRKSSPPLAIQFTGDNLEAVNALAELPNPLRLIPDNPTIIKAFYIGEDTVGWLTLRPGDWLVMDEDEPHALTAGAFEDMYERVEEP